MSSELKTLPSYMHWEDVPSLVGSIKSHSLVAWPTSIEQCRETLAYCRDNDLKVCPRGAGRSYGDEALHDGQVLLNVSRMNRILEFDEEKAQVRVEAGARLIDIFEQIHYRRLTIPSSPTESHSSVAGAIAANVNGKDGWKQGSFARQVVRLSLMTANGEILEIDREHELFNAVVSGIGLSGVMLDATLQLKPIPSPYLAVACIPAADVDELLEKMNEVEAANDVAVVWLDAYAGGKRTGRSVIHAGRWTEHAASEDELKATLAKGYVGLEKHRRMGLALFRVVGPFLDLMLYLQRPLVPLFNRFYYAMNKSAARRGRNTKTELFINFSFAASFTVPPAYLCCGKYGYTVQLVFPRTCARDAIVEMLGIVQASPVTPVTAVLRGHLKDEGLLSFSEDGYSLNFEFHPKKHNAVAAREAIDRLIEAVAKYNGRIHLAKDQVLTPEQFPKIYPRYQELLDVKKTLDPDSLFTSDLAKRVGLMPSNG
jgi:decaprenylphospho-beta-D-ribofuranose 2-oxidase